MTRPVNIVTHADELTYDNATSGLDATDVQAALDEVAVSTAGVADGFAGLVVVEAGEQASATETSGAISITWRWGISSGAPYFNSAGVTAGDEAALCLDPSDGTFVLVPVTV